MPHSPVVIWFGYLIIKKDKLPLVSRTTFLLIILLISYDPLFASGPYQGELIDSWSAIDNEMEDYEIVLSLMKKAGVKKTLLDAKSSSKGNFRRSEHAELVERFPEQLIPLLKTMNQFYRDGDPVLENKLDEWLWITDYKGMGNLKVYDPDGSRYAREFKPLMVKLTDWTISVFVDLARRMDWPFRLKVPYSEMSNELRGQYMRDLETLLSSNVDVNIVLAHLGQLEPKEVSGLLKRHKNLYLDISRSHPGYLHDDATTQIFVYYTNKTTNSSVATNEWAPGFVLMEEWRKIFNEYPDRFLIAYANIGVLDWDEKFYMENTAWFRKALGELDPVAADLIAHGNAERLWKL